MTTTLAQALSPSDIAVSVVTGPLQVDDLLAVGAEYLRVLRRISPTQAIVQRGVNGSNAMSHSVGDSVEIGLPDVFLTGPQRLPAFGTDGDVLTGLGPSVEASFMAGGSGGGCCETFGEPFPATGTAAGFIDDAGNMAGATLDASGFLKVNVAAGSSGNSAASATGAAVPVDADYLGVKDASGNLTGFSAATLDYDTGAGTASQTLVGLALPASGGPVAGGTGTNPLRVDPTGSTTQPVSAASLPLPTGAATAAKQPALGIAGTASIDVLTMQGIAGGTAVPISGTVTATISGVATAANQTNASQKTQVVDGSGNVIGATSNALDINIKSGNPTTIAVTNAGIFAVQNTAATPAGSNIIGKVGIDQTTPGTTNAVQANAGTNLNTSALALETGGNLASLNGKVTAVNTGAVVIASGTITAVTAITNALPAGTALLGKTGIDQTTVGVTNGVRTGHESPVAQQFTGVHVPATATKATITQASAGAGKRNVCTGFTFTYTAGATAITAATPLIVSIIDGASGGTTYLFRSYINIPAVAGAQVSIVRSGMWLVGSQATALTAEFSAAPGTNGYASVSVDGLFVTE